MGSNSCKQNDPSNVCESLPFCYICYQKHVSIPSSVWCLECEQGFCSECTIVHSSIQSSKSHQTTPIKHYLALDESIRQIRIQCPEHDEKYQMFCQSHDLPLCSSCIKQHAICKDFTALTTLGKNIKQSETINDIEESIKDIQTNVAKIITCIEKNKKVLDARKNDILSVIRNTRKLINEHLDTIEHRLTTEMIDLQNKSNNQLDSVLQLLHEKHTQALTYEKQVSILKTYGSDIQTFLTLRKMSTDIESSQNELKTMMKNKRFDQFAMECHINDKLKHLSSKIEQFGEVRLQKTPCAIMLDNHKDRHAQDVVITDSFDKLNTHLVKSINTEAQSISGGDITKDGKILLTNYTDDKFFISIDAEGNHLYTISTAPYRAFDLTCIDNTTIAVTSGDDNLISIVDISSRTVKKHIYIGHKCCGVTHKDGALLVCAAWLGILSINLTNEKITTIVQCGDLPPTRTLQHIKTNCTIQIINHRP